MRLLPHARIGEQHLWRHPWENVEKMGFGFRQYTFFSARLHKIRGRCCHNVEYILYYSILWQSILIHHVTSVVNIELLFSCSWRCTCVTNCIFIGSGSGTAPAPFRRATSARWNNGPDFQWSKLISETRERYMLCYQGYCATKDTVLPGIQCYQGYCVTKDTVLPRILCYQGYCVTRDTVLPRILCYQGYCVTKDTVLPRILCYQAKLPSSLSINRSLVLSVAYIHACCY